MANLNKGKIAKLVAIFITFSLSGCSQTLLSDNKSSEIPMSFNRETVIEDHQYSSSKSSRQKGNGMSSSIINDNKFLLKSKFFHMQIVPALIPLAPEARIFENTQRDSVEFRRWLSNDYSISLFLISFQEGQKFATLNDAMQVFCSEEPCATPLHAAAAALRG
jgi:hypothetical protein